MLNMFVAWSAREKKMTLLSSRNDGMRFEVQPKGWDVVSMYRINRVVGTGVKQRLRSIPWINLRELIDKFRKNDYNIIENNSDYSVDINDWTDMYMVENTTDSPPPLFFTLPTTTAPFSILPNTKTAPIISPSARIDSKPHQYDNANAVYWTPLGLLDMFNTGEMTYI
jgi:hypothetical protein